MEFTTQYDIHYTNNVVLEMAHCKIIPDRVVEYTHFKQLLEKAKYVGSDLKFHPGNNGGENIYIYIYIHIYIYMNFYLLYKT